MKITFTVDTAKATEVNEALVVLAGFITMTTTPDGIEEVVTPKKSAGRIRPKKEPETAEAKPEPKAKTKPEPKAEVEEVVEKTNTTEALGDVTLITLKEAAKAASGRTDRDTVLAVIRKYAPKLADVEVADYRTLVLDLETL